MELFIEQFKKNLLEIRLNISKYKYVICTGISTDLTKFSHFMENMMCLCISEYFEWLFSNLNDNTSHYEVPKDKLNEVNKNIEELIDYLVLSIPINNDKIVELFKLMEKCRYIVTDLQFWSRRNIEPKQRLRREVVLGE